MAPKIYETGFLTAVVPVCEPISEIENLIKWLKNPLPSNLRVVLAADISYPETVNLLRETVDSKSQLRLVVVSCRNPGETREYGRKFVESEFVCFWDSDDFPDVKEILKIVKGIQPDTDFLIGGYRRERRGEPRSKASVRSPENLQDIFINPGIWRMVFRTKSIEDARFPPFLMAEDQVFLAELRPWTLNYSLVGESLYNYTTGRKSQLTNNPKAIDDLSLSIHKICDLLEKEPTKIGRIYLGMLLTSQFNSLLKRRKYLLIKRNLSKVLRITIKSPSLALSILRGSILTYKKKFKKHE